MSDAIEQLLVGRKLADRYLVREVIGRGGMSVVYRAEDERLGRAVAVKVVAFPPDLSEEERQEFRTRLRHEAAAAARIAPHPNVVQIFDYGTDPTLDLDFIAMEYLRGHDLRRGLQHRPLNAGEKRRILVEAARGVAAGHRAGLVHRDVKPGNIFLLGESDLEGVKILDFGIAKALEGAEESGELTRLGRIPHSPNYTSPEQLDPARPVTAASDVYQLGLVGYELLAGVRPFSEEEREQLRRGVVVPLPEQGEWTRVDHGVRRAIERALRPHPGERYPTAAEFVEDLSGAPGDATLFLGGADVGDRTHFAPIDGDRSSAGGRQPPHPGEAQAAAPVGSKRAGARDRSTALLLATIALVVIVAGIAFVRSVNSGDPGAGAVEQAAPVATEELDAEFRSLITDAADNLRAAASSEEGADAAAAVQDVIADLHGSWVGGDLAAHLENYAERVDFRGTRRATRRSIGDIRRDMIEAFPDREMTLEGIAIEFVEPGRARALVDRSWRFEGDRVWEGAARDELVLVREGDRWVVVAERELESVDRSGSPS